MSKKKKGGGGGLPKAWESKLSPFINFLLPSLSLSLAVM